MRQVFEAFRFAFVQARSQREIARALGLAQSTVNDYLRRFRGTGLPWSVPPDLFSAQPDRNASADSQLVMLDVRLPSQEDWFGLRRD